MYSGLRDRLFGAPGIWNLRRCVDCGLAWLDPCPIPQDVGKLYSRYFTHQAPAWRDQEMATARAILAAGLGVRDRSAGLFRKMLGRIFLSSPFLRDLCGGVCIGCELHLAGLPAGRLLDVGCGDGKALALMRGLGWQVFGIEPDPAAAQAARQAHGVDVFAGTLEAARLPAESFDAVTLHHVIEHVPDPEALLAECRRVLKKDGRLVVMTPNLAGLGHRLFSKNWFALDPPRHLLLFTPQALSRLARRSGLSVSFLGTSARQAMANFIGSWMIRARGSFDMQSPGVGAFLPSLLGLPFQAVAHALCAFGGYGDDIVMVASPEGPVS